MEDEKIGGQIRIERNSLFEKLNISNIPKHSRTEILNHQMYFVARTPNRHWLNILTLLVPILAFVVLFMAIDATKAFGFILFLLGCLLFILEIFIVLVLSRSYNLKGMALDVENDLRPNTHYAVKKILPGEELCQLEIRYPQVSHLSPWAETSKLRQVASQQGAAFAPGLEFFIRQDGTFVFVHPLPVVPASA